MLSGGGDNQKSWVDLFAAIAGRNSSDIVKYGGDLIGSTLPMTEADLAYLTTVTAAAFVRTGQVESARDILKEQSKRLNPAESYWFPLLDLVTFTESGHAWTTPPDKNPK